MPHRSDSRCKGRFVSNDARALRAGLAGLAGTKLRCDVPGIFGRQLLVAVALNGLAALTCALIHVSSQAQPVPLGHITDVVIKKAHLCLYLTYVQAFLRLQPCAMLMHFANGLSCRV